MAKKRKLARGVAVVGGGLSKLGLFKDRNSKDFFAEAYLEMGIIHLKTQKPNEALAALEKAQEFNINRPEIFNQMGMAYEAKKDYGRAVEQYQKYLLTLPANPVAAQFRLGVCAMELGDFLKEKHRQFYLCLIWMSQW